MNIEKVDQALTDINQSLDEIRASSASNKTALDNIKSAIDTLGTGIKEEKIEEGLDQSDDEAGNSDANNESEGKKPNSQPIKSTRIYVFLFFLLTVAVFVVGWGITGWFSDRMPFDLSDRILFSFIAFIVALASYLASVGREVVKQISSSKDDEKVRAKNSMLLINTTEASLLILGCFILWRLFDGPYEVLFTKQCSELFIPAYMAAILIFMMLLHVRVWFATLAQWRPL